MKTSHALSDLQPHVADMCQAHQDACAHDGIIILITCTLRDLEEQHLLYLQGRVTPGNIVTKSDAGDSAHNYGLAYDVVPLRNGKPVWTSIPDMDRQLWQRVGELGESVGLEWAGRWKRFIELAHFQDLGGKTISQIKAESNLGK